MEPVDSDARGCISVSFGLDSAFLGLILALSGSYLVVWTSLERVNSTICIPESSSVRTWPGVYVF
eukprot:1232254-Amorphochlora_amoeboformis.AAC.3